MMINDETYGSLTPEKAVELSESLRKGAVTNENSRWTGKLRYGSEPSSLLRLKELLGNDVYTTMYRNVLCRAHWRTFMTEKTFKKRLVKVKRRTPTKSRMR